MKSHHTISITIPTRLIVHVLAGVLVGLLIGAVVTVLVALGIELWAPTPMIPALLAVKGAIPVTAEPETETPASTHPVPLYAVAAVEHVEDPLTQVVEDPHGELAALDPKTAHPSIMAFRAVPLPVRIALDQMVDRVLTDKWERAA